MPIDDATAVLTLLVASAIGIAALARGIAWLGDRATHWGD